ncbi:hypothetical protein CAPTEDRAFT_184186 [Capitella teleta]|uniref:Kelch domain-containing protein 10 n=1 Tax=Capitella teleta TaxID=283909 RepID=R7UHE2_CAPTE|nr:hypothetical protein CAPTEDRAFT_184186 [Capitella teleta]|eukprot:ELU05503.1 hypothetical protein CAPTEDRAFT_184186 [Capitella teleta]
MVLPEVCDVIFSPVVEEVLPSSTESLPVGRSGHCCCTDGSYLYVYGGYNPEPHTSLHLEENNLHPGLIVIPNREVLIELWIFHIASRRWTLVQRPLIPEAAASSCMVRFGRHLLVFGGSVFAYGGMMSNSLHVCSLHDMTWSVVDCGGAYTDYPPKAYGQSVTVVQNEMLYVFGGSVNLYMAPVSDLHRINLRSNRHQRNWERLNPGGEVPRGRYKHEMVEYDNRLYLFGGGQFSNAEGLDCVHVYCIDHNYWALEETMPDENNGFPKSRKYFGCAQRDNIVIICGGEHPKSEALDDLWTLDLNQLQWRRLNCSLPKPIYFHRVALTPSGKLYIYGGIVGDSERTSKLLSVQIFFPKLSELSWERLTEHFHSLHQRTRSELQMLGIPPSFLHRLERPKLGSLVELRQ